MNRNTLNKQLVIEKNLVLHKNCDLKKIYKKKKINTLTYLMLKQILADRKQTSTFLLLIQ